MGGVISVDSDRMGHAKNDFEEVSVLVANTIHWNVVYHKFCSV